MQQPKASQETKFSQATLSQHLSGSLIRLVPFAVLSYLNKAHYLFLSVPLERARAITEATRTWQHRAFHC
jgi:hypothetical protein